MVLTEFLFKLIDNGDLCGWVNVVFYLWTILQVDINMMTRTWGVEVGKVELYVTLASFYCIF